MNTPLSWIRDYVPGLDCTAQEYSDRMTLTGTKVENYKVLDKNLKNIKIGKIVSVEKHPDADKLKICQVNIGSETVQIVTGAGNISTESVGLLVPCVLDGGNVAAGHDGSTPPENGYPINAGKLRGIDSCGMMCSVEELGSDRNAYPLAPEEGIYIFDDAVIKEMGLKPGDCAIHALGMDDVIVEYEITSNRVDCYSIIGIAREAAATFNTEFKNIEVKETGNSENIHDYLDVKVNNTVLCPRYTARMVKNIRFAPSPEWMQKRLRNSGIRPINNLVDITNFVMQEFGQPMHAYDYDTLAAHKIVVECAKDGEQFQTLDGQVRNLDSTILMIKDGEKSVGIGGIMGGENSKITEAVHTVVFEAANFNGTNIRLSAKKVGLRTDASSIFEKGLDPANAEAAVNRACQLVEELGCGEVVGGIIDIYPTPESVETVEFEPDRINGLLGTNINEAEMRSIFKKIELSFDKTGKNVVIPSFRRDLHCMADLAEEVLRFHGYDKIIDTLPVGEATTGKLSYKLRVDEVLRRISEANGFSHAVTYAFESPKAFDKLNLCETDPLRKAVVISNPLGEDFSIMRTQPLNALLTAVAFNYNHRSPSCWLYDLSNIYLPKSLPLTELPDEREQLSLCAYGDGCDFFTMKGAAETILYAAGLRNGLEFVPDRSRNYFHPGRQAVIRYENAEIGYIGEVHPLTAANYGFKEGVRVYVAVIDVPAILPYTGFDSLYKGISKYPSVTRDISMLVPKKVLAADIERILKQRGGKLLENCSLFDIYEGEQVEAGYKSMAYSLSFRDKERSLTDEDVNSVMKKILNGLSSLGIELRS